LTLWKVVLFALAFSPAVIVGFFIDHYAVNIPTWDDWERVPLLEKWKSGDLTWKDLYAPHISHRILIPRLITLGVNDISGGDLVVEMWVIYMTMVVTGLAVFGLLRRSLGSGSRYLFPVTFLLNLMLFSPLQWQNFLWAIQVALMLPFCCIALALLVLGWARVPVWMRFVACLLLALVGTHSFGHGILVWPVVLLAAAMGYGKIPVKKRVLLCGVWLLFFGLVVATYYDEDTLKNVSHPGHAYGHAIGARPPGIENLGTALERPEKLKKFFFAGLGNQFSRAATMMEPLELAIWIGMVLLALFVAATVFWFCWRGCIWEAALPWFALGGAGVASTAMVALARSGGMGLYRALSPRYISMSLYLGVSLLVLVVILGRCAGKICRSERSRKFWRDTGVVAGTLFFALQVHYWFFAVHKMEIHRGARLHAKTNLLFINHFVPDQMERLDSTYTLVKDYASRLDALGYLNPPLLKDCRLKNFRISKSELKQSRAAFKSLEPGGDGELVASGYADLPGDAGRMADGVALVVKDDAGERQIFALADIYAFPEMFYYFHDHEFDGVRKFDPHEFSLWNKTFSLSLLPQRTEMVVEAWAIDSRRMKVYRLREKYRVRPGEGTVEAILEDGPTLTSG